jgi:hypothetical protein
MNGRAPVIFTKKKLIASDSNCRPSGRGITLESFDDIETTLSKHLYGVVVVPNLASST